MNIKIHWGHKKPIIEIATLKTKILLDDGVNLEENEVLSLPEIKEHYNFSDINAVFLSEYNTDHITLMRGLLDNVPVYAGKLASRIAWAAEKYKAKPTFAFSGFYASGATIVVGDIKVTPYLVDDTLFDGYLLLIENEKKTILYTGDYRANGRKSFEEMLKNLPDKVDVLLCKDGVISEDDINHVTERDIEEQATKLINGKRGPVFILQSVTDFDRATTIFRAANRNKRIYLEDLYMSQLACGAGKAMPNPTGWPGVRSYLTTGYKEEHFRYKMFTELPRLSKAEIAKQKFVMCIRIGMKKYLKTLSQCMQFKDGVIINSLPKESYKSSAVQEFLSFAVGKGLEVVTLRNSGHADAMALKALVNKINPAKIMSITTQNRKWLSIEYAQTTVVDVDALDC